MEMVKSTLTLASLEWGKRLVREMNGQQAQLAEICLPAVYHKESISCHLHKL